MRGAGSGRLVPLRGSLDLETLVSQRNRTAKRTGSCPSRDRIFGRSNEAALAADTPLRCTPTAHCPCICTIQCIVFQTRQAELEKPANDVGD